MDYLLVQLLIKHDPFIGPIIGPSNNCWSNYWTHFPEFPGFLGIILEENGTKWHHLMPFYTKIIPRKVLKLGPIIGPTIIGWSNNWSNKLGPRVGWKVVGKVALLQLLDGRKVCLVRLNGSKNDAPSWVQLLDPRFALQHKSHERCTFQPNITICRKWASCLCKMAF